MTQSNQNFEESQVTFSEPRARRTPVHSRAPKSIRWIRDHSGGLIKTEAQAGYVLSVFIILCIALSVLLLSGSGPEVTKPSEELINSPQPIPQ